MRKRIEEDLSRIHPNINKRHNLILLGICGLSRTRHGDFSLWLPKRKKKRRKVETLSYPSGDRSRKDDCHEPPLDHTDTPGGWNFRKGSRRFDLKHRNDTLCTFRINKGFRWIWVRIFIFPTWVLLTETVFTQHSCTPPVNWTQTLLKRNFTPRGTGPDVMVGRTPKSLYDPYLRETFLNVILSPTKNKLMTSLGGKGRLWRSTGVR